MIPTSADIRDELLENGPKTKRELIDHFREDDDNPSELTRQLTYLCVRGARRGDFQRVPDDTGRNPMFMAIKEKTMDPITPENAREIGHFREHRKTTLTEISTFTVAPGTPFQTPEGLKAEDEEARVAFDSQGGVYPIRESVYQETYELA